MKLLVLGGTSFAGRHAVEAALDEGHAVTLFNRGVSNPGLFPACEHRIGDRDAGDLSALGKGEWDGVIDVNGYAPRAVRQSVELLAGRVGHYTFISTLAVYAPPWPDMLDETSPLCPAAAPDLKSDGLATYGPMKVACEEIVRERFGDRSTMVRPSLIVGPYDPTDRFTYFVRRVAQGGAMIGPGRPEQPLQLIHARDLGDFSLRVTTSGTAGVFNAVGPTDPITLAEMLAACAGAAGVDLDAVWIDDAFLEAQGVTYPKPPYWPAAMGDGCMRASVARAVAAGLRNRFPVATAADTLAWDRTRDWSVPMGGGAPTRDRERALLDIWRARSDTAES
jgi:2'-hydroxyisoflavone reductase